MVNIVQILKDGIILSIIASTFLIISGVLAPRLWLQDYPKDIQAMVPPKTDKERRLSLILGIPFIALLLAVPFISSLVMRNTSMGEVSFLTLAVHAFGVIFIFNLVDWLVLDWLMFCTITPSFIVIPGSEGAAGYKDYGFHFRGFLIGILFSSLGGLLVGLILSI